MSAIYGEIVLEEPANEAIGDIERERIAEEEDIDDLNEKDTGSESSSLANVNHWHGSLSRHASDLF